LTCQSQDDVLLTESKSSILAKGHLINMVDTFSESLPQSALRRQSPVPVTNTDTDSDSDSDEEDQTNENAQKCDDKKFGQCVQNYAKQLGMKSMPADPTEYARALHSVLEKYGKIGFKKICSSGKKLVTCVGPRQIDTCMNITHLIELGLTQKQAYVYFVIYQGQHFECTKGFKVLYDNFDCITNVEHRSNATFVKCQQDFAKKMKQDPKNYCKYINQLVTCVQKPFSDKCKPEVATTICQTVQAELKSIIPKCQIKCKREDEIEIHDDMLVGGDEDIGMIPRDEDQVY